LYLSQKASDRLRSFLVIDTATCRFLVESV
jgi:hypothetical protein